MALNASVLESMIFPSIRMTFSEITRYGIAAENFVTAEGGQNTPAYQRALAEADQRALVISQPLARALAENIYQWLVTGAVVTSTIVPQTIATAGSPSAQVGPPVPVPVSGTVS